MNKKIVIIGASGHGKVVADIARKNGYKEIVFLDDDESIRECGGYAVIGKSSDAFQYMDSDFAVAIGNAEIRERFFNKLIADDVHIVSLIHPNAVISENVEIGKGTVIMAGAVINPDTHIGDGCIINTCSSIDHDCRISDFVHVSVGAHVAGSVLIGTRTWIGAGATVSNNVEITRDCIIGAGAVAVKDVEISGTYIGVPARLVNK